MPFALPAGAVSAACIHNCACVPATHDGALATVVVFGDVIAQPLYYVVKRHTQWMSDDVEKIRVCPLGVPIIYKPPIAS